MTSCHIQTNPVTHTDTHHRPYPVTSSHILSIYTPLTPVYTSHIFTRPVVKVMEASFGSPMLAVTPTNVSRVVVRLQGDAGGASSASPAGRTLCDPPRPGGEQ